MYIPNGYQNEACGNKLRQPSLLICESLKNCQYYKKVYRLDKFKTNFKRPGVPKSPPPNPPLVAPLKTCQFNILEQILLYIESVHSRYLYQGSFINVVHFFTICGVTNMSLGDIETIVSCNQSRMTHCDLSLGKFNF